MNDKYLLGIVFCIFLVMFISERKYHLKKQRGGEVSGVVVLGGILFVVAIIGGAVWYFTRDGSSPTPTPTLTPTPTTMPTPTTTIQTPQSNTCTCENGVGATGSACPSDGAPRCASCNEGYMLDDDNCIMGEPIDCYAMTSANRTNCSDLQYDDNNRILNNQQVCSQDCLDSINDLSDTVGNPDDTCHQIIVGALGGDVSTASSLINDNRDICQSLIGQQNTCTCENGYPATGSDCTSEGAYICASCNEGYQLIGNNCITEIPAIPQDCQVDRVNSAGCPVELFDDTSRMSINDDQVCPQQCLEDLNQLSDIVNNPDDTCYSTVMGSFPGDVSTIISDNIEICQNHLSSD